MGFSDTRQEVAVRDHWRERVGVLRVVRASVDARHDQIFHEWLLFEFVLFTVNSQLVDSAHSLGSESLCLPMVLSAFSHYSAIHLGLNMYVLYSFGAPIIDRFFGVEQFCGFYLSAGEHNSLTFGIGRAGCPRRCHRFGTRTHCDSR